MWTVQLAGRHQELVIIPSVLAGSSEVADVVCLVAPTASLTWDSGPRPAARDSGPVTGTPERAAVASPPLVAVFLAPG